jgi:hypothetical protein
VLSWKEKVNEWKKKRKKKNNKSPLRSHVNIRGELRGDAEKLIGRFKYSFLFVTFTF